MKIGILTLPIAENYGGILQAIALYRYLYENENEVVLIYKDTEPVWWKDLLRSILMKIPFHDFRGVKTKDNRIEWKKRKFFHRSFIDNEIYTISKVLSSKEELVKYTNEEKFDAVIVGSDQVWRITYKNDKYYKNYFLDFIQNDTKTKRIAYAASFGKGTRDSIGDEIEISKLLNQFDAISIREQSGVKICEDIFNCKEVEHVLDPTMLQKKEFYIENFILKYNISNKSKDGLLTYILDESGDNLDIIQEVLTYRKIKPINHLKGFKKKDTIYSVPEWLSYFANADFIITDSFHGMVFSIIFEKNFFVIGNVERGLDRFKSLLSILNLEDRLILNKIDLDNKINLPTINYQNVNYILDKEKTKSENFLLNSLGIDLKKDV